VQAPSTDPQAQLPTVNAAAMFTNDEITSANGSDIIKSMSKRQEALTSSRKLLQR
jgi:hypothetical protein